MKKIFFYSLIIISLLTLFGCSSQKINNDSNKDTFEVKTVTNLVTNYMNYLSREDYENCKRLYTKKLLKDVKPMDKSDLKIKGYKITEMNQVGNYGVFKIRVCRMNLNKAQSSLDEYSIKVIKEEEEYKIDEVQNEVKNESYSLINQIRIKSKNNVSNNLLIDDYGLPQYAFSKDDKADVEKVLVPKGNYGVMNFDYEGNSIAITLNNKNSFLGIVNIDESVAVQGGNDNSGNGGAQSSGGSSDINAKEKPVGKDITTIDLIKDAKIDYMIFSPSEKFIMAEYTKLNRGKCIRVYYNDSGNMIPYKFEDKYSLDKFDILFSSFDKNILFYEVIAKGKISKEDESLLGKWKMDLDVFEPIKL